MLCPACIENANYSVFEIHSFYRPEFISFVIQSILHLERICIVQVFFFSVVFKENLIFANTQYYILHFQFMYYFKRIVLQVNCCL